MAESLLRTLEALALSPVSCTKGRGGLGGKRRRRQWSGETETEKASGPSCSTRICPVPSRSPTDVFPTGIAVLGMASLVAGAAVGAALTHHIALPS